MTSLIKLLHIAAAIVWMGGMAFALLALRPVATAQLQPPARLPLMAAVLGRFFLLVWICIALLAATGLHMLLGAGMKAAPIGWHLMFGIGILMFLIFGHLFFVPFRRLKQAVAQANWPEGGRRMGQIGKLVSLNFTLGWIAIAAVALLR
ncbi:MAG TPA: CopD family protein [Burkholderiaceae bacterium]|nr:CopD family protein [Burkholderiaceae bacterium]